MPTLGRTGSFLSPLWLQFGELTGEDKGGSKRPVKRQMQSAWRDVMEVRAPVVTVGMGRKAWICDLY